MAAPLLRDKGAGKEVKYLFLINGWNIIFLCPRCSGADDRIDIFFEDRGDQK